VGIYVLLMLGFACEYRLLAAVCTLLPDIIIYGVYDYRMVYYHSLHRKVVTLRRESFLFFKSYFYKTFGILRRVPLAVYQHLCFF
jgi:hypothetical protein